ncbi:patatin-like phospholipase family protein [Sphingomonas sp. G-3-2-10]|uniref:patatin-like phospholipase family protein n=1 Tax=Sphingomonas sp. G-3-2-10 TaxID=2728838 RepID=UPI00146E4F0D|nr:patatin-like phospholipase family protein [Sphingomonas sp. G-3-2-10]NML05700.1 patatin-like phospholipase family protein [Sphingomonas sp. G-3-2-10]
MRRIIASMVLGLLLAGCAGHGTLNIDCPPFDKYKHDVPYSALEKEIHGIGRPGPTAPPRPRDNDMLERMEGATKPADAGLESLPGRPRPPLPAVLMLSGGGQWGAFGAGFLDQMRLNRTLPDATFISGISTGGLQALFVSIGTPEAYAALLKAYAPAEESEVVDRGGFLRVVLTGSMAGLKPLRARIEAALCPDAIIGDPAKPCALDALRAMMGPDGKQTKYVLIGFVEAASGRFQYVDVVELAQLPRREARTCITAAALASAAMPVNFQPVQINGVTYYDGGVRASVFEANVAASATAVSEEAGPGEAPPPTPRRVPQFPIYVVRNGPTTVEPDAEINGKGGAIDAAQRAEQILVNQMEVSSIAVIRIEHPVGPLRMVSADGWKEVPCVKPGGGVMFAPEFMKCLTRLGRMKANGPQPWIELSNLSLRPRR